MSELKTPLAGLLCGLSVLPLEPAQPIRAAFAVGLTAMIASTLLFDPLMIRGTLMMVVGRDKKWKKSGRPSPALVATAMDKRSKRLIFIRHGESEWNLIFNVGPKVLVPFKAVWALVREALMLLRLEANSVLYDSPLNEEGLKQARELDAAFRQMDASPDVEAIRGTHGAAKSSVLVSSNLRRAAQTVALACATRLEKTRPREKVFMLSSLQEISTNVDTLSVTPPGQAANLPHVPRRLNSDRFDASNNSGNKLLRGRGLQRLQMFAEWAFKRDEDVIIVGGHSFFFRYFFREFLPPDANPFGSRDSKIANGGVVALTLERGTVANDATTGAKNASSPFVVQYRIDPDSVTELYLGFDKPKSKKAQVTKKVA